MTMLLPVHQGRVTAYGDRYSGSGPVLYWMHREARACDNWALIHARNEAVRAGVPLLVLACLPYFYLDAGLRQYGFLLEGARETATRIQQWGIPFFMLKGEPVIEVSRFAALHDASLMVTDFDATRLKRQWVDMVRSIAGCPLHEVDARNVVPCRMASDKREYAARTLRPKLHRLLPEYLDAFPEPESLAQGLPRWQGVMPDLAWKHMDNLAYLPREPRPVLREYALAPGESAARAQLDRFLGERIARYERRNDPNADAVSGLSPYLHWGMISAQRVALEVLHSNAGTTAARESFLEELIVRRELADNFCLHTPDYDSVAAFPEWARRTLDKHRGDVRVFQYDEAILEAAATADPLWNAAQLQLMHTGTIHGYVRMYWAKQLLLWTASPEEALRIAIRQNDRWALDGLDSNGYAGIAWSIGGVHDRPWGERPVQGSIRSMTARGARTKFDVDAYVRRMETLRPATLSS